jgi:hypothetical protein
MSDNVRKKALKKALRFQKLIEGMRTGKTFGQIAEECQCSYKTIERDFWEWKDNGGFDKWLVTEFMILHDVETQKEDSGQAYRVIADLLKKRLKELSEVEIKSIPKLIVEVVDNAHPKNGSDDIKNESNDTENSSTQEVAVSVTPNTTNSSR